MYVKMSHFLRHYKELVLFIRRNECQYVIEIISDGFAFDYPWIFLVETFHIHEKHFFPNRAYDHQVS